MTEYDISRLLPRSYYSAPFTAFLATTPETILGALLANSEMAVEPPQAPSLGCFGGPRRDAWLQEIAILKATLLGLRDGGRYRTLGGGGTGRYPRLGRTDRARR